MMLTSLSLFASYWVFPPLFPLLNLSFPSLNWKELFLSSIKLSNNKNYKPKMKFHLHLMILLLLLLYPPAIAVKTRLLANYQKLNKKKEEHKQSPSPPLMYNNQLLLLLLP